MYGVLFHGNGILFNVYYFYSYLQFVHQLSLQISNSLSSQSITAIFKRCHMRLFYHRTLKTKHCGINLNVLFLVMSYETSHFKHSMQYSRIDEMEKVQQDLTAYNLEWYNKMFLEFFTRILLLFWLRDLFRTKFVVSIYFRFSTCAWILIWSEKIAGSLI